jgi:hypothetical protein
LFDDTQSTCEICGSDLNIRKHGEDIICLECHNQLIDRPKKLAAIDRTVVCLCGSTSFDKEFADIMLRETLNDKIVLTVGNNGQPRRQDIHDDIEVKRMLDRLHMAKIRMADEVIIINKGGYIGESTRRELNMAAKLGKKIIFEYAEHTCAVCGNASSEGQMDRHLVYICNDCIRLAIHHAR